MALLAVITMLDHLQCIRYFFLAAGVLLALRVVVLFNYQLVADVPVVVVRSMNARGKKMRDVQKNVRSRWVVPIVSNGKGAIPACACACTCVFVLCLLCTCTF